MDSSSSRMYFSSSSSEQGGSSSSSSNKESLAVSHLVQGSFGYFAMSPLPLACCSFETNLWKQSHDGWFYSNQVVQNLPSPASASLKPFTKTIPNFTKVNFQPVRGHQGGREKILPNPCTFQAAQCQARRTRYTCSYMGQILLDPNHQNLISNISPSRLAGLNHPTAIYTCKNKRVEGCLIMVFFAGAPRFMIILIPGEGCLMIVFFIAAPRWSNLNDYFDPGFRCRGPPLVKDPNQDDVIFPSIWLLTRPLIKIKILKQSHIELSSRAPTSWMFWYKSVTMNRWPSQAFDCFNLKVDLWSNKDFLKITSWVECFDISLSPWMGELVPTFPFAWKLRKHIFISIYLNLNVLI